MPVLNSNEITILEMLNEELATYSKLDENENIIKYFTHFFDPKHVVYCIVTELCEVYIF